MRLLPSVKLHTYSKMKVSHIHCNQRNFLQQKLNAFFLQVLKIVLHYYLELLQIYKRLPWVQYDVQETRRISREEGEQLYLIKKIIKKIQKHYSVERISDNLDESPATIQPIYDLAMKQAPDFDAEKILDQLIPKTTESLSK